MQLLDSNISPNIKWFLKFINNTTTFNLELYKTLANAQSSVNRVAYSLNNVFGTALKIVLTDDTTFPIVGYFNSDISYHLKVTTTSLDENAIFAIGPFYDTEISDDLVFTPEQQENRATFEINKGTHTKVSKNFTMNHSTTRIDGDIVILNVSEFDNELNKIASTEITWNGENLTDNVLIYNYQDLLAYRAI